MRNIQTTNNLIAVSANNKETAINTEQTLDTGILVSRSSMAVNEGRREGNEDEAIGKEERDAIYDLGNLMSFAMDFDKAMAQHLAFVGAFGLGKAVPSDLGGGWFKHTITPIEGDIDYARSNPSFTLAQRTGTHGLMKERWASCFVDSFVLTLAKDSWMRLSAVVKGTGKRSSNQYRYTLTAAYNAASLTLNDAIAGGSGAEHAAERLDNVHSVRCKEPGTNSSWQDVVVTAASDANPCILTITPPGGTADVIEYQVEYNRTEAGDYAWCSFPNRVVEPPIRVQDFLVNIGGKWNGTTLLQGHQVRADINSFEWNLENSLSPEFVPGAGTTGYANRALREGRNQRITFDRMFQDYILGHKFLLTEQFTLYMKAQKESVTEPGSYYIVEIIFPKVAVSAIPLREEGRRAAEGSEFLVLQDDTYGSVIVNVTNKVATYAT